MFKRKNPKTGKREGNWYIRVAGRPESSGTEDRVRAKALQDKLNAEAFDRRHGFTVLKWEEACRDWIEQNPVVAATYEAKKMLAFWLEHLEGYKLPEITSKLVHQIITTATWEDGTRKFLVDLTNPVPANSTANGYVSFAGRVIRHGSNLNPKLTYYLKPAGRDRWLSVAEWGTFSSKANPDFGDLCTFAVATLLRESNCMGFRWAWLKDNDTWFLIPAEFTKTAKPYACPLNKTAQAAIKRRRAAVVQHPDLVFLNAGKPWNSMSVCRQMESTYKAAEIDKMTFHGFRHTGATWLAQKGVSHSIRARLGCWATGSSMTDHYSHFDVESLRPFAEVIDGILDAKPSQQKSTA